ncbi:MULTISPECIES: hypothetical protein [Comamonas]|uniref:hypothetical protein n=1 Tax=Comamonas TaxID=283 RepID=UPI00237EBE31|nr:hypothetical protein [Comamonas aquatica]MDE1555331.1 hypothetical protein [Comamonas aquatica]
MGRLQHDGAPTLNGTAGALIALLDAFLVNGFGTKAVDSATVTDGICRMNITGGSAAQDHCVIQVAGITGDGVALNGPQRVKAATASYVEFPCDLPDGPLTGTITFKIAPAGWSKEFTGTNVAVYRSNDISGTRMFLRVDDTGALDARVTGYEGMSDVSNGVGPFPSATQVAGGGYWPKASSAGATQRAWTVVADSKSFLIHTHTAASSLGVSGSVWAFGDFDSLKNGDSYACALQCAESSVSSSPSVQTSSVEYISPASGSSTFIARSFTHVGSSIRGIHGVEAFITGAGVSGAVAGSMTPNYPNGPGNALLLTRKLIGESAVGLRGRLRGVHIPAQNCHASFSWCDTVDGLGGRKLLAVKCGSPAGTASAGVLFFDITGPWGDE